MPLVVIHHDIGVVAFIEIHRIGAERSMRVDSGILSFFNRRTDYSYFFGPEQPAFSGVGIDARYGDFGLCDQITLWATGHAVLQFQGDVTISPPAAHRTIQGNCN